MSCEICKGKQHRLCVDKDGKLGPCRGEVLMAKLGAVSGVLDEFRQEIDDLKKDVSANTGGDACNSTGKPYS
jgi:hypothetical protein